jgi:hypothetical protein
LKSGGRPLIVTTGVWQRHAMNLVEDRSAAHQKELDMRREELDTRRRA